ncbi:MAG: glycoside hydrolase family 88 protein [Bacteroidota bacterium]
MNIHTRYIFLFFLLGLFSCQSTPSENKLFTTGDFSHRLETQVAKAIDYIPHLKVDSMAIPRSVKRDGSLHGTNSRSWTSGFYPGELWMLYEFSGEEALRESALRWTQFVEKEKYDTHTHDLGFKVFCSFGQAYRITQEEKFKDVILHASTTLIRRYNPTVGAIRSWDFNQDIWQFPVIIDNMMNLEMLFEATRLSGDSMYYDIAYQHALTTLENHIRQDHSTYHVIDFDTLTGTVRNRHTHQGQGHESTWARGQAWNLYGFAMAYRETGDTRFLSQAKGVADFIYHHPNLESHGVPYWDFDADKIPNEPLDASAAAVAASGLLILCELDTGLQSQMLPWVDKTLATLGEKEFATEVPPFLLDHSVGSIPGDFEVDVPLIYADYYYIEALMRRIDLGKGDRNKTSRNNLVLKAQ